MTSGGDPVTKGLPRLALALVVLGVTLSAAINVWTRIHDRPELSTPGRLWEPISWEISSAIATLALVPLVWRAVLDVDRVRTRPASVARYTIVYVVAFYMLHVAAFVIVRRVAYLLNGQSYVFGGIRSWLYELPKDVITFLIVFTIFLTGHHAARRAKDNPEPALEPNPLRIKDGNRVFLVKPAEILAVNASGNYIEYYLVDDRRPLARARSKEAEQLLAPYGFLRTHRSWLVNKAHVREVRPLGNGDYELIVTGEIQVPVSRRLAEDVLQRIA